MAGGNAPILGKILGHFRQQPKRQQICDAFIVYYFLVAVVVLAYPTLTYCTFPFNALMSALLGAVGMLVLTVSVRMHISNPETFYGISAEKSFWEFCMCSILLLLVATHFMG
eukprot:TRINITY_DN105927_c0_g1_i1.p1 TRINITY_DN105927_c0_g1~~TRINITY_DN105927_c0_g1_i1.p1  ORF type:complete len:123 (+),score=17.90 TRINITY_DN105927_c0_g1_i1:36-371(+)